MQVTSGLSVRLFIRNTSPLWPADNEDTRKEQAMMKIQGRWMNRMLWCSVVACSLIGYGGLAHADDDDDTDEKDTPNIVTIDHHVPHVSTVPANKGATVNLFVRERVRRDSDDGKRRKAVLMIHGFSTPVLPAFELNRHYDWAGKLAKAGLDVFMLDFQGSGRSPRPRVMDDPCNVPKADQESTLIPNPLASTCPPKYAFQLVTSQSDWDELNTVVDFIIKTRGVKKVALVSWSQGSFRVGPYAVQHPEKVESLFLFAAIFNASFRPGAPVPLPQPGTPMSLRTRSTVMGTPQSLWDKEVKCEGQVKEGIQDDVWNATMDNDPIGRTWGPPPVGAPADSPPEGVMRVRTPTLWGWNAATAAKITVPVLIIRGELDMGGGGLQQFDQLYAAIPHDHKLWFTVQCAGHFMQWERQSRVLHAISKQWLKHGAVEEETTGKFFVDTEGTLRKLD